MAHTRTVYSDGTVVLGNVRSKTSNETYSLVKTLVYCDGTAMTDAKVDGKIYRKLGSEYFVQALDLTKSRSFYVPNIANLKAISLQNAILLRLRYYTSVHTGGYTTAGDGGGCIYAIANTTAAADDGFLVIKPSLGLVQFTPVFPDSSINVKVAGAKGDGITDDTANIQKVLNYISTGKKFKALIPNGTFMVNAVTSLLVKSDSTIDMSDNTVIKAIANNVPTSHIIKITDVSNVVINGGTLIGDRATHIGTTGETGMGCSIYNSTNVVLNQVTAKECWGDGFYVSGTGSLKSYKVKLNKCNADNNRRQGLSIVAVDNCVVDGGIYSNSNAVEITGAQAGIDIEANPGKGSVTNVKVVNVTCFGNMGCGIVASQTITSDVLLQGNTCYNNALDGIKSGYVGENIKILNNDCYGNAKNGINVTGDFAWITKDIIVSQNNVHNNGEEGVYITNNVDNAKVTQNTVKFNGRNGIRLSSNVSNSVVENNTCHSNSQSANIGYDNIVVENFSSSNRITNNICRKGVEANKPRYGIYCPNDNNCEILFNDIGNGGETANFSPVLPTNIMRGNKGFVTESNILSDTFDISTTGIKTVTVAHGIQFTPAKKDIQVSVVTETVADSSCTPQLKSIDATNLVFIVNVITAVSGTARLSIRFSRW